MTFEVHPKTNKITIEIPDEFVDKDLKVEIKPRSSLDELFGVFSDIEPDYEMEKKAWELAVKEKYGKS